MDCSKALTKKPHKENRESSIPLITWLTLTGIQFLDGPWVSGMEIHLKISQRKKSLATHGAYGP